MACRVSVGPDLDDQEAAAPAAIRAPIEAPREALGRPLEQSQLSVGGAGKVFFEKNSLWPPP